MRLEPIYLSREISMIHGSARLIKMDMNECSRRLGYRKD